MKSCSNRFRANEETAQFIENVVIAANPTGFMQCHEDGSYELFNIENRNVTVDEQSIPLFDVIEDAINKDEIKCDGEFKLSIGNVVYHIVGGTTNGQ